MPALHLWDDALPGNLALDQGSLLAAAQAVGSAAGQLWHGLTSPLAVFGDAWLLNILFLLTGGLLLYSLVVAGPKQ